MRQRIGSGVVSIPLIFGLFFLLTGGPSFAQDFEGLSDPPPYESERQIFQGTTATGETVWHVDVNSGCSFSDHNVYVDIPVEPDEISDASIKMTNHDVDYIVPEEWCEGRPEVDYLYINGHFIGRLQGANDSWSTNIFEFPSDYLVKGSNHIYVDTDATGTGCWCVAVGYVEISGNVGFRVTDHTPSDGKENVLWNNPGITVEFSSEVKTSTATTNTVVLDYRDQQGNWVQVNTTVTMLSATKAQVTPPGDLKDGIRYRMRVLDGPGGVLGVADNELEEPAEWYFWTMVNLDGQTANLYKPNKTKDKLQITWFNVSRNEDLIPYRWVANRIYVLWDQKGDVFDDDEVKEIKARVTFEVNGSAEERDAIIKRPDRVSANEKRNARNTINFDHVGGTEAQESYTLKVEPRPWSGETPKVFEKTATATRRTNLRSIEFNYMASAMAGWYNGPVASELTRVKGLLKRSNNSTRLLFPVNSVKSVEKGTVARGNGGFNMEYTTTKRSAWWDDDSIVGNQTSENVRFVKDLATNVEREEIIQVLNHLATLKPASHKVIVGLVPSDALPGALGLNSGPVILLQDGQNDSMTLAHEIGHFYNIATSTGAGCTNEHNNDGKTIEGFNPYSMKNKSYEEGNTDISAINHKDCQGTVYSTSTIPLMNVWGVDEKLVWIRPDNYRHLLGQVGAAFPAAVQAVTGDYMVVTGYTDGAGTIESVSPLYRVKQQHVPAPTGSGYSAELFSGENGTGTSLGLFPFSPDTFRVSVDTAEGSIKELPSRIFAFTIPFDDAAQSLVISAPENTVVINKSDNGVGAPMAAFTNPMDGDTLSGTVSVTWTGSDDGGTVHYRLEFSPDGGSNWIPISSQMTDLTGFSFDTTPFSDGTDKRLAIIAYDGFNSTREEISISINNGVIVTTTVPLDGAVNVSLDQIVSAGFASDMDETTFTDTTFVVLASGTPLEGQVIYDSFSQMAFFKPTVRLEPDTTYTARLVAGGVYDTGGSTLPVDYEWSFTTGTPSLNPQVAHVSPLYGATNVPVSALIQATFADQVFGDTVNSDSFTVKDPSGTPVAGTITLDYNTYKTALFVPNANLAPDTTYTVTLTKAIIGNPQMLPLESDYTWSFTTGTAAYSAVRIVRVVSDAGRDKDGDGLYDELVLTVEVEILNPADWWCSYNLNGQLRDKYGENIDWTSAIPGSLGVGVWSIDLIFDGNKIAGHGVDGPYEVKSLYIYDDCALDRYHAFGQPYRTYPYQANAFYSVLRLSNIPQIAVAMDSNNEGVLNLEDYATHSIYNVADLSYRITSNSQPDAGVQIDAADHSLDIQPAAGFEGYTDVTLEARDQDGIASVDTFRVNVLENYRFPSAGWYTMSLSSQPENTDISSVLGAIDGKYDLVWTYENGVWKLFNPANPGLSDLSTLEAGKGYWIRLNQPANLVTLGAMVEGQSTDLVPGWNFVGYNATVSRTPADAFSSIAGRYLSVWVYDAGAWKAYVPDEPGMSDLVTVRPGYGYWINTIMDTLWTLP